jgi:hypothetical protein
VAGLVQALRHTALRTRAAADKFFVRQIMMRPSLVDSYERGVKRG